MKDFADNGDVVAAVERVMKKLQGDVSENDKNDKKKTAEQQRANDWDEWRLKAGAKKMKSESGRPSEARDQQRGGEKHSRAKRSLVPRSRLMKANRGRWNRTRLAPRCARGSGVGVSRSALL
jgi:hypothetical protein